MVVDGGMVSLEVKAKMGPDVRVEVVDPGLILSRANLTFKRNGHLLRARNSMLPVLSSKVSSHRTYALPLPCHSRHSTGHDVSAGHRSRPSVCLFGELSV